MPSIFIIQTQIEWIRNLKAENPIFTAFYPLHGMAHQIIGALRTKDEPDGSCLQSTDAIVQSMFSPHEKRA